jgi:hypothetical protein
MSSPWFSNRGQILQATAAICAAIIGLFVAWPSIEKAGVLSIETLILAVLVVLVAISLYRGPVEKVVMHTDGTEVPQKGSGGKVFAGIIFGIILALGIGGGFLFAGGQIIIDGTRLGSGERIVIPPPPHWRWDTLMILTPSGNVAFGWADHPNGYSGNVPGTLYGDTNRTPPVDTPQDHSTPPTFTSPGGVYGTSRGDVASDNAPPANSSNSSPSANRLTNTGPSSGGYVNNPTSSGGQTGIPIGPASSKDIPPPSGGSYALPPSGGSGIPPSSGVQRFPGSTNTQSNRNPTAAPRLENSVGGGIVTPVGPSGGFTTPVEPRGPGFGGGVSEPQKGGVSNPQ